MVVISPSPDDSIPYDDIAKSLTADEALEVIYSKIDELYAQPEVVAQHL